MKLLLLAGEESGLIYAKRIRSSLPGWEVRGYGDYGFKTADLAVMGFFEVLKRLRYFIGVKRTMERAIDEWRPDAVCTIDYPGMNLKIAAYAKAKGIAAVHVVCPQVWAWKSGRIPKIEASVDRLCCFLPFETGLFRPGFAEFVGHPLVEDFGESPARAPDAPQEGGARTIALLPGSRLGEIRKNLPVMLEAVSRLEGVRAIVPAANEVALKTIEETVAAGNMRVETVLGGARDVLKSAYAAVVASGTATLEAALARCPTVLVYKVGPILACFARHVIKGVKHIGLANIIWEKTGAEGPEPMEELLQENFTADNVVASLKRWLDDPGSRDAAIAALDNATAKLRTGFSPVDRIVAAIKDAAGRLNV